MSGLIPILSIFISFGEYRFPIVYFIESQSTKLSIVWIVPFPKLCVHIIVAHNCSLSHKAIISDADALYPSINIIIGRFSKSQYHSE